MSQRMLPDVVRVWQWCYRPGRPGGRVAHAFIESYPYFAVGCGVGGSSDPDDWIPADPEHDGTRFCNRCYNWIEAHR
jgi:hypothetical protein